MQTRYLYAAVTATGQVYFDMPSNSTIKGVQFAAMASSIASGDYIELELSQASTNQTAVNDALSVIAIATFACTGSGTPASTGAGNLSAYMPADVPIKAGERVYLNYTESGSTSWRVRCLVYYT